VTGEWRKLHNEKLHNLYSSPDIIRQVTSRRMRWEGHVARMGEERKVYKVLVGKPKGKRPLGRPRRRWEDGIRIDLREIGLGGLDWIRLAQDMDRWRAVVSEVMNLRVLAPRSWFTQNKLTQNNNPLARVTHKVNPKLRQQELNSNIAQSQRYYVSLKVKCR
jgi:hypothetical protein